MNFLAHARLSFSDPEVLVGNMISDFVKGRRQYDYPAGIQKGIRLHRAIDQFTDTHPVNQEAKLLFRPAYRLYAGAMVDVVYDHFLATDEEEFDEESLRGFERGGATSRKSVEWVMNHVHVADLHHGGDDTISEDKVLILGHALKEIYQAKLARDFPHAPCIVEFYEPEADGDLIDYQISFWQVRHEVAD